MVLDRYNIYGDYCRWLVDVKVLLKDKSLLEYSDVIESLFFMRIYNRLHLFDKVNELRLEFCDQSRLNISSYDMLNDVFGGTISKLEYLIACDKDINGYLGESGLFEYPNYSFSFEKVDNILAQNDECNRKILRF